VENSETKLLPLEKDHQLPLKGSTCFDDQLTHPLHANLLLQHEQTAFMLLKN